jgi:hypothetical protein
LRLELWRGGAACWVSSTYRGRSHRYPAPCAGWRVALLRSRRAVMRDAPIYQHTEACAAPPCRPRKTKRHQRKIPVLTALPSHLFGNASSNDSGKHQQVVQKSRWTGCHFNINLVGKHICICLKQCS